MNTISRLLLSFFCVTGVGAVSAQTVDVERGELPLMVPSTYDSAVETPLVVLLHGYGSSGSRQESYMQFGELVDSHGFLLIYPDGSQESRGDQNRFWNASKACCDFRGGTVDDSAYVMSVIAAVESIYNIDEQRIYLVGHSNGGFMSYRVAYEHSSKIAAIVSLAGAGSTIDRQPPPAPVHVLQIHGTDDETIAYEGGRILGNAYPGAVETVERWAAYNGCAVKGIDGGTLDLEGEIQGMETTVQQFSENCLPGGSSELWTIVGGSHIPTISEAFTRKVIEWLFAHPKS